MIRLLVQQNGKGDDECVEHTFPLNTDLHDVIIAVKLIYPDAIYIGIEILDE